MTELNASNAWPRQTHKSTSPAFAHIAHPLLLVRITFDSGMADFYMTIIDQVLDRATFREVDIVVSL